MADTGGGGQPDSGACSILDMSLCSNGDECCIQGSATACACLAGTAQQGGACSMTVDCGPGFVCGLSGSSGTCYRWCVYPGGTCPTGTSCMEPFSTPPSAGGVTYGACM